MSDRRTILRTTFIGVLAVAAACAGSGVRTVTSADGVSVQYEVFGSGEPTLVLVHGWTNNRTFWQPHAATLARSHRVVVLDLPGFGTSDTNRNSWTMELFGQDVAAVIRSLPGARVVAVGFSMGGAAVLEAARLVPDRMAGVVLVDILKDPNAKYPESFIKEFVDQNRSSWHDPSAVRATGFSPETPDSLDPEVYRCNPGVAAGLLVANSRRLLPLGRREATSNIVWPPGPVVAINADQPPTNIEAWRRLVPSFKVATMTKVGHLGVIWEKTDEFDARLLDFVNALPR